MNFGEIAFLFLLGLIILYTSNDNVVMNWFTTHHWLWLILLFISIGVLFTNPSSVFSIQLYDTYFVGSKYKVLIYLATLLLLPAVIYSIGGMKFNQMLVNWHIIPTLFTVIVMAILVTLNSFVYKPGGIIWLSKLSYLLLLPLMGIYIFSQILFIVNIGIGLKNIITPNV